MQRTLAGDTSQLNDNLHEMGKVVSVDWMINTFFFSFSLRCSDNFNEPVDDKERKENLSIKRGRECVKVIQGKCPQQMVNWVSSMCHFK